MDVFTRPIRFLFFLTLLTVALYYGREVIIPFCFAGLLSMLFLPVSRKLESKGLSRGTASLVCVFIFMTALAAVFALLTWQMSDLAKDMQGIEQKIKSFIDQGKQFISQKLGISEDQQTKMIEQQKKQSSGGGQMSKTITGAMSSAMSMLVNFILVLVYIFLLLYFRTHLKNFVLKLVPAGDQAKSKHAMEKAAHVAQQYLAGLAMMIGSLWVLYGIGFSIVGVKNALFFAVLCGILEIVPFIGNILGTSLTIIATLAQDGDTNSIIGILIVYGIVQFVQTYLLEPLVVGAEVNINPLATILILVIGETLWGIPGMVLAIPLLGIVKIICDHVDALKPYGFLIGEEKKPGTTDWKEKLLKLFGKNDKNKKRS